MPFWNINWLILTPEALDENVTFGVFFPARLDPHRVRMRRPFPVTRNPDVMIFAPDVVAFDPNMVP